MHAYFSKFRRTKVKIVIGYSRSEGNNPASISWNGGRESQTMTIFSCIPFVWTIVVGRPRVVDGTLGHLTPEYSTFVKVCSNLFPYVVEGAMEMSRNDIRSIEHSEVEALLTSV